MISPVRFLRKREAVLTDPIKANVWQTESKENKEGRQESPKIESSTESIVVLKEQGR
jgi:hypothetical protein